jgi:PEGA domain-containing protein
VQRKTLAYALLLFALTARNADAQWFPGPVFGYPPPGFYLGHPAASVRTQVTPRETQVFVDGYSAGLADDFDGVFQRLQLVPGQHEIVLYLPGYRTYQENVYLNPGSSHSIRHTMARHAAGDADEPPPTPFMPPAAGRGIPPGPIMQPAPRAPRYGTVALRMQPSDANVIIDGEEWRGSQSQDRMVVQLGEGRHHVQIQKPGFQTFSADVDIKAGETTSLNVSLVAQ